MPEPQQDDLDWPRGRKIVGVRAIAPEEMESEGWDALYGMACSVLILDDGSLVYPSQDPEGNGPGTLFGKLANGTAVSI